MPLSATARRNLAPLGVVTATAAIFVLLLLLVRLQWAPLESADHYAAARLNSLVAGHPAPARRQHRQGRPLAGQQRRAVDGDRSRRGSAGHPAPVAARDLPAGHRG